MDELTHPPTRALASIHTHSRYCDGHGEIADYAKSAYQAGLVAYGASGHAPLPFPCDYAMPLAKLDSYCRDVQRARDEYSDRIVVLQGLELDYVPGLSGFYEKEFLSRDFDFFVASVHYVGTPGANPWAYDESEEVFRSEIERRHQGDARPVVEDYYHRVVQMVEEVGDWTQPVVVGHLDRVGLWNVQERYFPTSTAWYEALVDDALAAIQRSGLILEINTSGWTKPVALPNPGLPILRKAASRNIPVIVSADAHRPAHVDRLFPEGVRILAEAGYREIVVPDHEKWYSAALPGVQEA